MLTVTRHRSFWHVNQLTCGQKGHMWFVCKMDYLSVKGYEGLNVCHSHAQKKSFEKIGPISSPLTNEANISVQEHVKREHLFAF